VAQPKPITRHKPARKPRCFDPQRAYHQEGPASPGPSRWHCEYCALSPLSGRGMSDRPTATNLAGLAAAPVFRQAYCSCRQYIANQEGLERHRPTQRLSRCGFRRDAAHPEDGIARALNISDAAPSRLLSYSSKGASIVYVAAAVRLTADSKLLIRRAINPNLCLISSSSL
jgi:hypothetical protein